MQGQVREKKKPLVRAPFFKFLRHNPVLMDLSELITRIPIFEFEQRLPLLVANFRLNFVCYNNVRIIHFLLQ